MASTTKQDGPEDRSPKREGLGALVAEPKEGPTGQYLGLEMEGAMVKDLTSGAEVVTFQRYIDPVTGQTVEQPVDSMDQREIDSKLHEEKSRLQKESSSHDSAQPVSEAGVRAAPTNPEAPPREGTPPDRPQSPTGPTGSTGSTRTDSTKAKPQG
jgi:hypothetical protein